MRFNYKVFFASIISILLIVTVFITCIDIFAFQRNVYKLEYKNLNTAQKLGMSETDLYVATDTLLDYLKDYRSNINVKVDVHNKEREVFNQREKDHMIDVKALYQTTLTLRNIALGLAIALALFIYYDKKKEFKEVMSYAYVRVFILFMFFLTALLIYIISDFNAFWTNFHKIFFTNDLWLLDPNTSLMINMFPETFFNHLVLLIGGSFSILIIAFLIISNRYQKKLRKQLQS